jgi:hypothetical protein
MSAKTFGQKAVDNYDPCPIAANAASTCKAIFAQAIDQLAAERASAALAGDSEKARLVSIAITETQGAQMWAIKAVTWKS